MLEFEHFESTFDMEERLCIDTPTNCPFTTGKGVEVSDRQWKKSSFKIPSGTQKVFIVAQNSGKNQGAAAIDNIKVRPAVPGSGSSDANALEVAGDICDH